MEWRENKMVGITAGILLVVSIIIIFFFTKKETYTAALVCENSETVFFEKIPIKTSFPLRCPASGKKTAYLAGKYQCPQCGKSFILPLKGQTIKGKKDALPPEEMASRMEYKCSQDGTLLQYRGRVWETSEERR